MAPGGKINQSGKWFEGEKNMRKALAILLAAASLPSNS